MTTAQRIRRKRQAASEKGKRGNEVKRALMFERRAAAVECGTIVFDGPAFGGRHIITLYAPDEDTATVLIDIDGIPHTPRTLRGLKRIIGERIWKDIAPTPWSTP